MDKKKRNKALLALSVVLVIFTTIGLVVKIAFLALFIGWYKKSNVKDLIT